MWEHVYPALFLLVHEVLQADAEGLARRDHTDRPIEPLAFPLTVLDERVHDDRLSDSLHRHVVARPFTVFKQLLRVVVLYRLGILASRFLPASAKFQKYLFGVRLILEHTTARKTSPSCGR